MAPPDMKLLVKTGFMEGAGTDANVYVTLVDENDVRSDKTLLDVRFYDDLERGHLDSYKVNISKEFGKVTVLHLERDSSGFLDDWYCDYIIVQDNRQLEPNKSPRKIKDRSNPGILALPETGMKAEYYFPIHRWICHEHKYIFHEYACYLPQDDPNQDVRQMDLIKKQETYQLVNKVLNGPAQIKVLPPDEKFSDDYFWTFATEKAKLLVETKFISWTAEKWKSMETLTSVYKRSLGEPNCIGVWKEDWWFGVQRLQGVNPTIIELCTQIPENFGVLETDVAGLLDDFTLEQAVKENKIFICDLEILDRVKCPNNRIMAAPIALFYLNKEDKLMPIAIQLMQEKGPENPVYTPNDPANMWLVAKMWYNNSEAQHHQGITHLGHTHLLIEGICVCAHRNLSPSHPMFKLMAPHFLFLLAINSRGLDKLLNVGGWVDTCMTQGVEGIFEVISRGLDRWDFELHSCPERDLRHRGVLDPKVLPYYPYRDDALPLDAAIRNYVHKVVSHYYDAPEKIRADYELKSWRDELVKGRTVGGVGVTNLPGSDEEGFQSVDEITDVISFIISTCSLGHAASNFQQYEQYGFVPNYPGLLTENPPTEKRMYTDANIMSLLPNMEKTLEIMVITKLLSLRATKRLGEFEMLYSYHPFDVQAAKEFVEELKVVEDEMHERDSTRPWKFPYLDPQYVPNSISV